MSESDDLYEMLLARKLELELELESNDQNTIVQTNVQLVKNDSDFQELEQQRLIKKKKAQKEKEKKKREELRLKNDWITSVLS